MKRTSEATTANLIEQDELPMKKRMKIQADHDFKTSETCMPLIKLVSAALAEISDDDNSSAEKQLEKNLPKIPTVVQGVPTFVPTPLPSSSVTPLRVPATVATAAAATAAAALKLTSSPKPTGIVTTSNYCHTGKPLACPPKLLQGKLQAKFALKEIDSTLQ